MQQKPKRSQKQGFKQAADSSYWFSPLGPPLDYHCTASRLPPLPPLPPTMSSWPFSSSPLFYTSTILHSHCRSAVQCFHPHSGPSAAILLPPPPPPWPMLRPLLSVLPAQPSVPAILKSGQRKHHTGIFTFY